MSELHKFIFDGLPVRGIVVRLTDTWTEILRRRASNSEHGAYAPPVREMLGEMVAAGVLSAESKAREFATDRSKLIVGIEDVWRCWYGNPKISQAMHWQASMAGMVPLPPPTLASLDASTICEHTLTGRLSPDKLGAKAL